MRSHTRLAVFLLATHAAVASAAPQSRMPCLLLSPYEWGANTREIVAQMERDLRAHPGDRTAIAALADFLNDLGDPRGEAIQAQLLLWDRLGLRRTEHREGRWHLSIPEATLVENAGEIMRLLPTAPYFEVEGAPTAPKFLADLQRLRDSLGNNPTVVSPQQPLWHTLPVQAGDYFGPHFSAAWQPEGLALWIGTSHDPTVANQPGRVLVAIYRQDGTPVGIATTGAFGRLVLPRNALDRAQPYELRIVGVAGPRARPGWMPLP